ncbi:MAG TPA: helix-turn-helix transcriptional regulator [Caulobacteraceae bacterium]|jgi:transcriptional regulator with XRE-family HTH domain|nr:helix-turn-helix transcriptional regulator [Caulobacteraceae bacterium]
MPRKRKIEDEAGPPSRWNTVVGDNIRYHRRRQSLTQQELSTAAGVDLRYLGSIERGEGNPSVALLGKLAEVLKVHPSELLHDGVQPDLDS